MATVKQIKDHVSEQRQAVTAFLDSVNRLRAGLVEWNALGLDAEAVDGIITGEDAGIGGADVAAVYVTLGAIETLLAPAAGHATNLYKVKL